MSTVKSEKVAPPKDPEKPAITVQERRLATQHKIVELQRRKKREKRDSLVNLAFGLFITLLVCALPFVSKDASWTILILAIVSICLYSMYIAYKNYMDS